jgi:hypothetical protein
MIVWLNPHYDLVESLILSLIYPYWSLYIQFLEEGRYNFHFSTWWTPCVSTASQEEALGEGTFSTVFRCRDADPSSASPSNESPAPRYAVKFTRSNETTRRALEREVKIMSQLITKVAPQDTWKFAMEIYGTLPLRVHDWPMKMGDFP